MSAAPWIVIFVFGVLCLNWPVLEIFRDGVYPYLLAVWVLYVALIAFTARGRRPPGPPSGS